MDKPLLKIENLESSYGAIQALRGVSLEVYRGEIVSLIGSNGAGKSTLLNSIFKIPTIVGGQIYYNEQNITKTPAYKISKLGIALVPEGRRIFSRMSVYENLILGTTPINGANTVSGVKSIYEMFPILEKRKSQVAGTLSGGEQQMLAIGRALMSKPNMLMLDEPSLGLAPLIIKNIFNSLVEISKNGTTIFLVEQNAKMALKISSRGYLLVNGQIKFMDTASRLLTNPLVIESYMGSAH